MPKLRDCGGSVRTAVPRSAFIHDRQSPSSPACAACAACRHDPPRCRCGPWHSVCRGWYPRSKPRRRPDPRDRGLGTPSSLPAVCIAAVQRWVGMARIAAGARGQRRRSVVSRQLPPPGVPVVVLPRSGRSSLSPGEVARSARPRPRLPAPPTPRKHRLATASGCGRPAATRTGKGWPRPRCGSGEAAPGFALRMGSAMARTHSPRGTAAGGTQDRAMHRPGCMTACLACTAHEQWKDNREVSRRE